MLSGHDENGLSIIFFLTQVLSDDQALNVPFAESFADDNSRNDISIFLMFFMDKFK